ncbi:hypothetical protein [Methylobacterium sp. WSM2598]|uniref:hypothetical protein n=1 Tax=Methylobacterium sp. WSM2598 TaxID=398261 RepID=UPI0012F68584|nr:hypothetical protein [Methylobacterium sp. WSM2598]
MPRFAPEAGIPRLRDAATLGRRRGHQESAVMVKISLSPRGRRATFATGLLRLDALDRAGAALCKARCGTTPRRGSGVT